MSLSFVFISLFLFPDPSAAYFALAIDAERHMRHIKIRIPAFLYQTLDCFVMELRSAAAFGTYDDHSHPASRDQLIFGCRLAALPFRSPQQLRIDEQVERVINRPY
jgi:hypothetical protein